METYHQIESMRARVRAWQVEGEVVGFVPTMGNLHEGHLRLVRHARRISDRVVASVFVNPTQFGPSEDFDGYPRTLEADSEQLRAEGTDALFAPPVSEVYPRGLDHVVTIHVPGLSDILCGAHRPGHFTGVATVVCKLFNMIAPDRAVFGRKDFQQYQIIRRMVADLNVPVEVIGSETARAPDGLALSSRNAYLEPAERQIAPALYRELHCIASSLKAGERDFLQLEAQGWEHLRRVGMQPDYVSIRRRDTLEEPVPDLPASQFVVLGAARLGRARLIDNIEVADL
ncbi:pantoate--beta-alanine ligase [Aquisalimonas sp.]|uniref:pantoate--beta-alanine ligase n=1 Tax=Aquisalimonas sp. TaxID=1872621 RepID=UPI0025BFC95C|nr:pantoate--beta-alanine ligase [Aquisalimonas sp.]